MATTRGSLMTVNGIGHGVYVRQVSDFFKTCINGEFTGWQGDSVFQLCNGEVWQQAESSYTYHYAFMPSVLIYQSGAGYRMRVDGVDRTLGVTRVR